MIEEDDRNPEVVLDLNIQQADAKSVTGWEVVKAIVELGIPKWGVRITYGEE